MADSQDPQSLAGAIAQAMAARMKGSNTQGSQTPTGTADSDADDQGTCPTCGHTLGDRINYPKGAS